jgi:hypothetical protein
LVGQVQRLPPHLINVEVLLTRMPRSCKHRRARLLLILL